MKLEFRQTVTCNHLTLARVCKTIDWQQPLPRCGEYVAGLDTLEKEPIDPSNPLVSMDNVLTAPHIGGATQEASSRSSVACAQAIDDYFSGRTPKFVVPELRDLIQK